MLHPMKTAKAARKLFGWINISATRISVAVLSFIGFITSIISFLQLFLGNRQIFTIVLLIMGGIIWLTILGRLAYMGFSKQDKKSGRKHSRVHKFADHQPAKQWLLVLSTITLLSLVGLVGFTNYKDQQLRSKTIILLTNFKGPNPENYLVNEKLLKQLNESLIDYPDILIQTTRKNITEEENSPTARILGKQYRADLVLWGYYGVTNSNVLITIHIENMNSSNKTPLSASETTELLGTANQLDSFQIQQTLANQMTALVYFLAGITRSQIRNDSQAIDLFTLAMSSSDWAEDVVSKAYVLDFRAGSYINEGKFDLATADLTAASELHPDDPKILTHQGALYRDLGDLDKSLDYLNKALSIDASYVEAYLERAGTYNYLGQPNDAFYNLDQAIQLEPNNPSVYVALGNYYFDKQELERAIEYATKAINLDKYDSELYSARAFMYMNSGEYQQALEDFNMVIKLNPVNPLNFNNRSVAYSKLGNIKKACDDISRAIELGLKGSIAHGNLGSCYYDQGLYEKALEEFSIALSFNATTGPEKYFKSFDYYNRANTYLKIDNIKYRDEAISDLREAVVLLNDPLVQNSILTHDIFKQEIENKLKAIGASP